MEKIYKSTQSILKTIDEKRWIKGVIAIPLNDLIGRNGMYDDLVEEPMIEDFNQYASNALLGEYGDYLQDISYVAVGTDPENNIVFVQVTGDASEVEMEILSDYNCEEICWDIHMETEDGEEFFYMERAIVKEWFDELISLIEQGDSPSATYDKAKKDIQMTNEAGHWIYFDDLSDSTKEDVERGIQEAIIRHYAS